MRAECSEATSCAWVPIRGLRPGRDAGGGGPRARGNSKTLAGEENTSGSCLWRVGRGIRPESQFLPESALRYQLLQQQRLSHTVSIVTMSRCWVCPSTKASQVTSP